MQGVSEGGCAKLGNLLIESNLIVEPRPSSWNRRGSFRREERLRYLWYRHTARILHWQERHQFPDWIAPLLREIVFPSPRRHEEACETPCAGESPSTATVDTAIGNTSKGHEGYARAELVLRTDPDHKSGKSGKP